MTNEMELLFERAKTKIGRWSEITNFPYAVEYTAILRYLQMTDNDNPLFSDPEYAATTRHGRVLAPPLSIFGICDADVRTSIEKTIPQTPGTYGINLGQQYEFFLPVYVGDHLSYKVRLSNVEIKAMKYDPVAWWISQEICYMHQDGRPVCQVRNLAVFHRSRKQIEGQEG